jgi:hypothetical protein
MRVTLTIHDTPRGIDVSLEAVHNDVPCSPATSLACGVSANIAVLLAQLHRAGIVITERGGKPTWLASALLPKPPATSR